MVALPQLRPPLTPRHSSLPCRRRAYTRVSSIPQVKIINSKDLFSKPEKVAADVASFAGLSPHEFFEFGTDREASCDPRQRGKTISSAYSKRKESEPSLRKWYAEHNSMLFEDLGVDLGWNDRIKSMMPASKVEAP